MRRKLLALAALALAGTLLFSSAAAPGGDQIHEDVALSPSEGPNGAYAVMEDDELALRFDASNPNVEGEGVNAGTVTPFHDVFTITYTGDQRARVWLTTGIKDIRFYRGDDPGDTIERRADSVVLKPDETISIGVEIDASDGSVEADADQFTVHAELPEGTPTPTEQADGGDDSGFDFGGGDGDDGSGTDTPDSSPTDTPGGGESGTAGGDGSATPANGTDEGGIGPPGSGGGDLTPTPTPTVDGGDEAAEDPGAADDPGSTPAEGDGIGFEWWWPPFFLGILVALALVARRLYAGD